MHSSVSIVDCEDYDEKNVYSAVKEAFDRIGGLGRYAKKGQKVLLKVNLLQPGTPDRCITTHPAVVDAVCRLLKGIGAEIWIGDSSGPFLPDVTERSLDLSGIRAVGKKHKARILNFDKSKREEIIRKDNRILKKVTTVKPVIDADLIISMPKLKTHLLTRYTGAVKNMYGVMPGKEKPKGHRIAKSPDDFADVILDIYQTVRPGLALMDGIVGMEGTGPSHGRKKFAGIIMASDDPLAMDIVAAGMMGFRRKEVRTNLRGINRGLTDPSRIKVLGNPRKLRFRKPIKIPDILMKLSSNIMRSRPVIDSKRCIRCRTCIMGCPVGAIDEDFRIDNTRCVLCYCCHELCPNNAVRLRTDPFLNSYVIFRKLLKKNNKR
jgi:uncharacterized protein (DUF362 family)/NAD-dependent dihydropyrimidine dehydrogenase PreA subunit